MKYLHIFISAAILFTIMLLPACKSKASIDPVLPHTILKIDSKVIKEERVITVWTPPNYEDREQSFPVLYMLDGGVKEDFPHIANTISKMIDAGEIAPLILVGIENTDRRRDLSGASQIEKDSEIAPVTDGATVFAQFIETELFREIESQYRVTDQRAVVGESFAGLFVVDTLMRRPTMFDVYIAMDPSLWWDNHSLTNKASEILASYDQAPRKFWFTASRVADINLYTEALSESLDAVKPNGLTWVYDPRPEEEHSTIFRATKEDAFRWALWPAK